VRRHTSRKDSPQLRQLLDEFVQGRQVQYVSNVRKYYVAYKLTLQEGKE
jgi:hypothetical protein